MKVEEYLKKLGFEFTFKGDFIVFSKWIMIKKELQDNIDLLKHEIIKEMEDFKE